MKTIEVDEDLYRFIAGQTERIGESASDILRRLLQVDSQGMAPIEEIVEPKGIVVSKEVGFTPEKFDGVKEMRSLPRIVAETEVGKPVEVIVWRDGKDKELTVSVGELKDNKKIVSGKGEAPAKEMSIYELGLTLTVINDKVRRRFKLKKDAKGVVITKVDDQGPTFQKEIRPGDVIKEVSQQGVSTPADVKRRIDDAIKADRKSILLHLAGQNGLRFVAVRLRKK